jgi:hypothetical protein
LRWARDVTWPVEVFVVQRHLAQSFEDLDVDAVGGVLDGGLGELAVVRAGAQAADQGKNPGGHL